MGKTLLNDGLRWKNINFDKSDQINSHEAVVRPPKKTYFIKHN